MNGSKVFWSIVATVATFLVIQVFVSWNRVTVLEERFESVSARVEIVRTEVIQNRLENRDEHKEIDKQLDSILEKLRK